MEFQTTKPTATIDWLNIEKHLTTNCLDYTISPNRVHVKVIGYNGDIIDFYPGDEEAFKARCDYAWQKSRGLQNLIRRAKTGKF